MAARDFVKWVYTTKDGDNFRRRADAFITTQLDGSSNPKVGGAAATGAVANPMPRNYRPRRWHGSDSGGYKGSVVCYTETAPLLTDHTLTINVRDASGTSHTLTYASFTPERLGRSIG
jgi:hypothetical protein